MEFNATLIGQMITFLLFVLFTKRFVWPYITQALRERQEKIAEGLAAAERGHRDLALAQEQAVKQIRESKAEGVKIVDDARKHAAKIIDDAKKDALAEGDKVKQKIEADIEQMYARAQETLRQSAARMAIFGAEKVLSRQLDEAANQELLDALVKEI